MYLRRADISLRGERDWLTLRETAMLFFCCAGPNYLFHRTISRSQDRLYAMSGRCIVVMALP